jgi:hypothetical protein
MKLTSSTFFKFALAFYILILLILMPLKTIILTGAFSPYFEYIQYANMAILILTGIYSLYEILFKFDNNYWVIPTSITLIAIYFQNFFTNSLQRELGQTSLRVDQSSVRDLYLLALSGYILIRNRSVILSLAKKQIYLIIFILVEIIYFIGFYFIFNQ